MVACPNVCHLKKGGFARSDMATHLKTCTQALIKCPFECGQVIRRCDAGHHNLTCVKTNEVVQCHKGPGWQKCGAFIKRMHINSHKCNVIITHFIGKPKFFSSPDGKYYAYVNRTEEVMLRKPNELTQSFGYDNYAFVFGPEIRHKQILFSPNSQFLLVAGDQLCTVLDVAFILKNGDKKSIKEVTKVQLNFHEVFTKPYSMSFLPGGQSLLFTYEKTNVVVDIESIFGIKILKNFNK